MEKSSITLKHYFSLITKGTFKIIYIRNLKNGEKGYDTWKDLRFSPYVKEFLTSFKTNIDNVNVSMLQYVVRFRTGMN